jgi:hypothetical protein
MKFRYFHSFSRPCSGTGGTPRGTAGGTPALRPPQHRTPPHRSSALFDKEMNQFAFRQSQIANLKWQIQAGNPKCENRNSRIGNRKSTIVNDPMAR